VTRRRRGGGVEVCSLLRAFAAKKTSRSCMGLSDASSYCCGVAVRYAFLAAQRSSKLLTNVSRPASLQNARFDQSWLNLTKMGTGFPGGPIGRLNVVLEVYIEL